MTPEEAAKAFDQAVVSGKEADVEAPQEHSLVDDAAKSVGQHAALAANSAAFGLGPKLAHLAGSVLPGEEGQGERYEREAGGYIAQAREDNPISGVIAELAGGMAIPIPGLGAAKTAKTLARLGQSGAAALGRGAITGLAGGAAQGAIRGATQGYGEGQGKDWQADLMNAVEGAKGGALAGGAVGGVLGTAGGLLAQRALGARAAATGGGKGDITRATRMSASSSPYKVWESIKSGPLAKAETDLKIMGRPFQTSADVAKRATEATDSIGNKIGVLVNDVSSKVKSTIPTTDLHAEFQSVADAVKNARIASSDEVHAANKFLAWGKNIFDGKSPDDLSTMADLHQIRESIRKSLGGPQHMNTPGDNMFNALLKGYRNQIGTKMEEMANKVDPKLGARLKALNADFNAAATVRDLSQGSVPRWDTTMENILGKGVRGMVNTMGFSSLVGPTAARMISGVTSTPGVVPNTVMAADRLRRANLTPQKIQDLMKSVRRTSRPTTAAQLGGLAAPQVNRALD